MNDKEFWQLIYLAAIQNGKNDIQAILIANGALLNQPGGVQ